MKFPQPAPNENLTPAAKARYVKLLKKGLKNLESFESTPYLKTEFVCHTVDVGDRLFGSNRHPLKALIEPRLDGYPTVAVWLISQEAWIVPGPERQAYRKAWMLDMIRELSVGAKPSIWQEFKDFLKGLSK